MEDVMKALQVAVLAGMLVSASPALANHPGNTDIPFASRGECSAHNAELRQDDKFWLVDTFPDLFDTVGEASSFLNRAFTCEIAGDGQWYITDHRIEVLESEWFLRR